MMSYSDFPAPKDFPIYMPNIKVMEYLQMYARKFDLTKHIRFNTTVKSVKKTDDYDVTGKWQITYFPHGKEIIGQKTEIVDYLLVCTGHHWIKNVPRFEGMDDFQGKMIHSKQYKDFKGFENKTVLVIGTNYFILYYPIDLFVKNERITLLHNVEHTIVFTIQQLKGVWVQFHYHFCLYFWS